MSEKQINCEATGQVVLFGILWPLHCECGAALKQAWRDGKDFARFCEYDCGSKRMGWIGPTETAVVKLCLAVSSTRR